MPSPRMPLIATQVAALMAQAARLRQANRLADSIAPLREAARLEPGNFAIQHDLGLACMDCGRLPEAIAALHRAVEINPRHAKAHWRLGVGLEQHGDAVMAVEAYRRAVALLPSLAEAQMRLAMLLDGLGQRAEVLNCYRRAAASQPNTSLGRLAGANVMLSDNRDAEAERLLRQTLARDATHALAHELLGRVLADAGRFPEAHDSYAQAIAHAPQFAGLYYDLVRCRRITQSDGALIAQMEAALNRPGLSAERRLRLTLALGKAADDLGDYALAMQRFDAADSVRRGIIGFDLRAFEARVDRLIAGFSAEVIARAPELGSQDATPILILGMPRSGTTLVEQIISAHGEVGAGGELHFWTRCGEMMEQAGATGTEPDFLAGTAQNYLRVLRTIAPKAVRVTDKQPFNFVWAGLIHLAFPRAAIIHCRRGAIDTALSIHQTLFATHYSFPTGGAELVAYYRAYERLMAHWRRVLPPDRFLEVDYEALIADPEPVIRRMVGFCGVPWDEACLHPEANTRVVKTPSKWQVRQPINRNSVERWRRYEAWLGALRELV